MRDELNELLQVIVNNSQDTPKNVQHNNAQNAVLFEAINLAIHLDSNSQICMQAAVLLGRFISSKETNVRYLGLETMAHLAACADSLEPIRKHQETIIMSLRDKDISVRRRGLDLLYSMCDNTNSKIVISELLRYLQIADYTLREEMVLKIAILTEKFATAYSWYVDIILQLISTAGDHVGEEVWFRVVQIVTNNEDLQEYAAKTVLNYLRSPQYNETMIKVGGYILGEFGHLIANSSGCSPIEQFTAVHSKFNLCSLQTRSLLLTTYVKFVNLFPEIKGQILTVFNQYRHVLDSELQQRACEYMAIATLPTDDMLQTVCEEMPPFPEKESTLVIKLNQKQGDTEDKRVWVIGGKEANIERRESMRARMSSTDSTSMPSAFSSTPQQPVNGHSAIISEEPDLLGLDDLSLSSNASTQLSSSDVPTPGYEPGYHQLQRATEGVLYEDSNIQIGLKSEYHGHLGRVALYFGNKTNATFQNLTTQADSDDSLSVVSPNKVVSTVEPKSQVQQLLNIECNEFFRESPSLRISYISQATGPQRLHLKLPIVLTKFMEPIQSMDGNSFFQRWKQIGGAPRESQVVFKTESQQGINIESVRNILAGYRFGLLNDVDPNPNNFVGAGVVHGGKAGKVGALLRLEPNMEQHVSSLANIIILFGHFIPCLLNHSTFRCID
jgi:AP-2 complex subunit alpha